MKEEKSDEKEKIVEPVIEETETKTDEVVVEVVEKENKSELANGGCETEKNGDVVNGKNEEKEPEEDGGEKEKPEEIKVKKLEDGGEKTTTSVSVEA